MDKQFIKKEDFGDSWPFTVECGVLINRDLAIIFVHSGELYAVNGLACNKGYSNIDPIWADNEAILGTKISLSKIISAGLNL